MAATKSQIEAVLKAAGYRQDQWGAWRKEVELVPGKPRLYKVKLQDKTIRVDVKSTNGQWYRIGGAFYSRVMITEDKMFVGSLALHKPIGCNPAPL